ncbi:hypothetical protein [Halalkalibacterium halodurans]|uniref:Uncharacterized protein n=1 Tax=Halalkalibacterium halodurans TaxID=86665 RepID=A0A0M0KI28_ALKHA|nr:hypothetical protein [Halalkalibacterium halodurans]TPE65926.1 hypothetical protein AMD02_019880 [Halalkalibacterium halodurans]
MKNKSFSFWFLSISIVVSIIIGILIYWLDPKLYSLKGFEKGLEGVLLLTSISLGFYGACLGVLASIFNTKIVKEVMNDKDYRKEYIIVSISALTIGFITVIATIIYQVVLENGNASLSIQQIINAVWISLFFFYICISLMFICVTFLIFFNNSNDEDLEEVHSGELLREID